MDEWRRVSKLARRQHGVFSLQQALSCGFSRSFVRRRLADGAWEQVEPRIYRATTRAPSTAAQRLMARTLATGGVASGRSAAALYGLLAPPRVPEVLVPRCQRSARHRRAGISASGAIDAADLTTVDGIPSVTPARMLITLADVLPEPELAVVLDAAIVRRLVTARRAAQRATDLWTPRRHGCAMVLRLLEDAHPQLWRARNDWEARVLRALRRSGAPDPIPNHEVRVGGRRRVLDFAWPAIKVAVEFDGFVPHSTRRVFDDDRSRQNDLVDENWRIFRLTATAMRRTPERALAPVLRAVRP